MACGTSSSDVLNMALDAGEAVNAHSTKLKGALGAIARVIELYARLRPLKKLPGSFEGSMRQLLGVESYLQPIVVPEEAPGWATAPPPAAPLTACLGDSADWARDVAVTGQWVFSISNPY